MTEQSAAPPEAPEAPAVPRARRTGLWAAIVLLVAVAAGAGAYAALTKPERAVASFTQAVASGDDATVAKLVAPALATKLSASGAKADASLFASRYPNLATMRLERVSSKEVRLVDGASLKRHIVLARDGGWHVASASYFETATGPETIATTTTVHKTKDLPRGTTIYIVKPKKGKATKTFSVLVRDGVEVSREEVTRDVDEYPTMGEAYKGTGKKGRSVSRFLTGSKFDRARYRVAKNTRTVKAKDGRLGASWRTSNPRSGERDRLVLLGPDGNRDTKGSGRMSGGAAWYDVFAYIRVRGGEPLSPTGRWIVIVERDGKPSAWRVVTVK